VKIVFNHILGVSPANFFEGVALQATRIEIKLLIDRVVLDLLAAIELLRDERRLGIAPESIRLDIGLSLPWLERGEVKRPDSRILHYRHSTLHFHRTVGAWNKLWLPLNFSFRFGD